MKVDKLEGGFYRFTTFRQVETDNGGYVNVVDAVCEFNMSQLEEQRQSLEDGIIALQGRLTDVQRLIDAASEASNEA